MRISRAFPPLTEDVASLLLRVGGQMASEAAAGEGLASPRDFAMVEADSTGATTAAVRKAYLQVLENSVLEKNAF